MPTTTQAPQDSYDPRERPMYTFEPTPSTTTRRSPAPKALSRPTLPRHDRRISTNSAFSRGLRASVQLKTSTITMKSRSDPRAPPTAESAQRAVSKDDSSDLLPLSHQANRKTDSTTTAGTSPGSTSEILRTPVLPIRRASAARRNSFFEQGRASPDRRLSMTQPPGSQCVSIPGISDPIALRTDSRSIKKRTDLPRIREFATPRDAYRTAAITPRDLQRPPTSDSTTRATPRKMFPYAFKTPQRRLSSRTDHLPRRLRQGNVEGVRASIEGAFMMEPRDILVVKKYIVGLVTPKEAEPSDFKWTMATLKSSNWQDQQKALASIQAEADDQALPTDDGALVRAVSSLVLSPRSALAKQAVSSLHAVAWNMPDRVSPALDLVFESLFTKAGSTHNAFVQLSSYKALLGVVVSCSLSKTVPALLRFGDRLKPPLARVAHLHAVATLVLEHDTSFVGGSRTIKGLMQFVVKSAGDPLQEVRGAARLAAFLACQRCLDAVDPRVRSVASKCHWEDSEELIQQFKKFN